MVTKTLTYVDFDGTERTETFYFNLTKAELVEYELSVEGGLSKKLTKIVEENDVVKIMKYFKEIILKAYGEKSDDGKRFIKSKELSNAFEQTQAYSELIMEFITDSNSIAAFIKGLIPSDMDLGKIESNDPNVKHLKELMNAQQAKTESNN